MASSLFSFDHCLTTNIGKVRTENQDSYAAVIAEDWVLLIVCDGMGGTKGGSIASILAVEVILKRLSPESKIPDIDSVQKAMKEANAVLNTYAKQNVGLEDMGTTAIVFFCSPLSTFVCHVGDSRLYRLRNKKLEQLTKDHTWVQELVDAGAMEPNIADKSPVSHLLTRAFGTSEEIDIEVLELDRPKKDDLYFLCSDGLYGELSLEQIREELKDVNINSLDEKIDNLLNSALSSGGKDNITIAGLYVESVTKDQVKNLKLSPVKIKISNKSNIDIEHILYDLDEATNDLLRIADETKIEVSPNLFSEQNSRFSNSSSVSLFVLGLFISVVLALFFIISGGEPSEYVQVENKKSFLTDKEALKLKSLHASISEREAIEVRNLFSFSPSAILDKEQFNSYFEEVLKEHYIFSPNLPVVQLPLLRKRSNEGRPNRPIVWENEALLLDRVRDREAKSGIEIENDISSNEKLSLSSKINSSEAKPSDLILSDSEIFLLIEEKDAIRSRLVDTDEKILQLSIMTLKDRDIKLNKINLKIKILQDELDEIATEDERLRRQINHLEVFLEELNKGNYMQIAERLLPLEGSLKIGIMDIKSLSQEITATKRLIRNSEDQISLAEKLSRQVRDLRRAEEVFQKTLKALLVRKIKDISMHRSKLSYVSNLLTQKTNSKIRHAGYLNAYTELSPERTRDLYASLTEERNLLYSELEALNRKLSIAEEIEHNKSTQLVLVKN